MTSDRFSGLDTDASRWLRALSERFPRERAEFACCFERIETGAAAWIAVGRLASITCDVREGAVVTRLECGDRLLSKQVSFLDGAELPYEKIFSALASAVRTERALLPAIHPWWSADDARQLQFFGGWKYVPTGASVARAACFHLPKLALRIDDGGVRVFDWGGLDVGDLGALLRAAPGSTPRLLERRPEIIHDRLLPARDEYLAAANAVLASLARGECEKVVLSRKRVLEYSRPLDPLDVHARVVEQRGHVFQYLMSIERDATWVGISPELLLRRSGQRIETRPLAGSRRRGSSAAQDATERESLLASEKDGREHAIAAGHMFERLKSICEGERLEVTNGRDVTQLSYIQHLATEMKGRLDPCYDAADALACIYPPATILGIPERAAERVLRTCEPFDRSFFTGGVGVLSSNGDCDLALCIRSAMITGNELHLYAGSGYVEGSSPDDEWRETATKMQPFVTAAHALASGDGEGDAARCATPA